MEEDSEAKQNNNLELIGAANGEILRPDEFPTVSHWNPTHIPWYHRPVTRVLAGCAFFGPVVAEFFNVFLQMRGYVNLTASRIVLAAMWFFMAFGWCIYAFNRPRWQRLFAVVGSVILLALVFGLDRITLPSKSALALKMPVPAPTLEALFKSDFSEVTKFTISADPTFFEDGERVVVTAQEYADFPAHSSFIGYYIPSSPLTFRVCVRLANSSHELLDAFTKRIMMQTFDASATRLTDLTFSGRVFIYHEWPLTLQQKSKLVDYYNSKHLAVEFRGADYLRDQTLARKSKPM